MGKLLYIMIDYTKYTIEKNKALKKLLSKWIASRDTRNKADFILAKNPSVKLPGRSDSRKTA